MADKPYQGSGERRRHPRYGFCVHVNYRNVNAVFSAVTRNVSRGGCFIQTDSLLPEGTPIWLEFSFTGIPVKLGNIQGRVAWSTRPGDPSQGMGIEYENVPDVVEDLMTEFIDYVKRNSHKAEAS
ncbi:MAG: PilZ domain-containing protein [Deltaproteobacteria bacterium]|nr:PilZ domain-containing protein [Deltaproteobacteria bacterium]MBW2122389.1 PilZ domain-containing protein [Deltaproteobacteria bacterium]